MVGKLPTGPLLGAFDGVEFEQAEARLDLDEMLFLYTDGLTEARPTEQYGEDRLDRVRSSLSGARPQVVRDVLDDVVRHAGGELQDDLAILAVRRVALAGEEGRERDSGRTG